MNEDYWYHNGFGGLIVRALLRTLQFFFAFAVAILYGLDLHSEADTDASWIYAEVVSGLSMVTCITHLFFTVTQVAWCVWDWVLCVLWAAQLGVFGMLFLGGKETPRPRMTAGVWIDLINLLLWFTTAMQGIVYCCSTRRLRRRKDYLKEVDGAGLEMLDTAEDRDFGASTNYGRHGD
ncbi:hypothetical protein NKR23_g10364 [Pleurostoma richardsiae]|uniref:MARVEL domain-containing protein n=1 Tax=Pleurostoma richardsiae TaxID=41990 RepID=A0AA38RDD8_9PEZI|nr:hypothetical protein NKR23_g10364 [Pleurostoma richardsiae]